MPKPLITFMFKGLGMDCFGSFFLIDRGFTFWVFALEWGLFFVCEEWKICFYWRWFIVYFREDLLSTQEGRVLNWEGIYDYIAERFNCLFLPGIGFCWEGIHLVHGDFFWGGIHFLWCFLIGWIHWRQTFAPLHPLQVQWSIAIPSSAKWLQSVLGARDC